MPLQKGPRLRLVDSAPNGGELGQAVHPKFRRALGLRTNTQTTGEFGIEGGKGI